MLFLLIIYRLIRKYGNTTLNLRVISTIHISSSKAAIRLYASKTTTAVQFYPKCKPNNILILQGEIVNANKTLIAQRLCAFLALAQLLINFVFLFF